VRRPFPEKRCYKELFTFHGNVCCFTKEEDRVTSEAQAKKLEGEGGYNLRIYTDGSVSNPCRMAAPDNTSGAAWLFRWTDGFAHSHLDSVNAGLYQHSYGAERVALTRAALAAVDWIGKGAADGGGGERGAKVLVLIDCLSLIQSVERKNISEQEDIDLHAALGALARLGKVELRHVSAHKGVLGNEIVDVEAKRAAASEMDLLDGSSLTHGTVKSELKLFYVEERRKRLRIRAKNEERYSTAASLQRDFKWRGALQEDWEREPCRLLNQLAAGHCPSAAGCTPCHNINEQAVCRHCLACKNREHDFCHVDHLLFRCKHYAKERQEWVGDMQTRENVRAEKKDVRPKKILLNPDSAFRECDLALTFICKTLLAEKNKGLLYPSPPARASSATQSNVPSGEADAGPPPASPPLRPGQ